MLHINFTKENVLEFLAKKQGIGNGYWMGNTVLHIAAKKGYLETASFLIEKGAKVDSKNLIGETPLYMAAERGDIETANFLIKKGAKVDSKTHMELHYSIWLLDQKTTVPLNYLSK